MPLTAAEQKELAGLEDVFGVHVPTFKPQALPDTAGVTPTGIKEVPIPDQIPGLTLDESQELIELEADFKQQLPTVPPRAFQGTVDEFVRALGRGSLNVGSGLLATFADIGQDSLFDVDRINELAEQAREASRRPEFQPGTDGGVRGFIANAVGDALPFMAGTIAATLAGGPVAGFGVAYAVEGKNAYFDALDAGASQEEAEIEGFVVGSINAALESLQVGRILKFAEAGKGSVRAIFRAAKQKSLKKALAVGKKIGKEALKNSVTEGIQEALQETVSVGAPALTGRELPTFAEGAKRIASAALGGAVAAPFLGGAGSVVQAALEGKTTFSRKDVKELGVDEPTSAEERQQMFNEAKEAVAEQQAAEPEIAAPAAVQEQEIAPEPTEREKLLAEVKGELEAVEEEPTATDLIAQVKAAKTQEELKAIDDLTETVPMSETEEAEFVEEHFKASQRITPAPVEAPVKKAKVKGKKVPKKAVTPEEHHKLTQSHGFPFHARSELSDTPLKKVRSIAQVLGVSDWNSKQRKSLHRDILAKEAELLAEMRKPKPAKPKVKGRKVKAVKAVKAVEAVKKEPEVEKEIEDEQETITEPAPSAEVEQRKAEGVVPESTGKFNPEDPKEALEIIERHKDFVANDISRATVGGVFEAETKKGELVITSVEYTTKQIDTAYRTVQKQIPSTMPDVELFAMPGKEAELQAIAKKMAKIKPVKKKGKKRPPQARPLPRAKTKQEDHVKAVWAAASVESKRFAITGVLVDGENLVATDGRRIFVAQGKWGKDGIYLDAASLKQGLLGKAEKEGNFPKWQEIVPDVSRREAIEVGDLDKLWNQLNRASLMTSEESKGVTILVNKDGSLGFATASPDDGHAEINVFPGAKILGAVNPRFFLDSIKFHAIRGDTFFDFYFQEPDRPMLTRSSNGKTMTVIMPVQPDVPSEVLKEVISEPKIKGAKNIVFTKEAADKAKKDILDKNTLASGLNPALLLKLVTIGGFHVEAGVRDFTAWSVKMVEELGDRVKPHLQKIWDEIQKTSVAVAPEVTVEKPVAEKKAKPLVTKKAKKVKITSKIAKQLSQSLSVQGVEIDTYRDTLNLEKNAKAAQNFVTENTDEAVEIAFGGTNKTGITKSSIIGALALQAQANENFNEMQKFTELLMEHNLEVGWEGASNKSMMEKYTILEWYATLKNNLINAVFKPQKTVLRRVTKSAAKVARDTVNRNVKSAAKAIKEGQMKVDALLAYVESQRC